MTTKPLKSGFTTGAAAAAATKAALLSIIEAKTNSLSSLNKYAKYTQALNYRSSIYSQDSNEHQQYLKYPQSFSNSFEQPKPIQTVNIRCLNDEIISINIHSVTIISDKCVEATVIKDAGDDPDITHKAEIGAKVSLYTCNEPSFNKLKNSTDDLDDLTALNSIAITIRGGKGVGIVTKPGLEVMPGNPAINSGPQTMIREAIRTVISSNYAKQSLMEGQRQLKIDVEIFVPKGAELAKKTLNERLGIIGGISILGTTGIVKPMSHEAYIATIKAGLSVAVAAGLDTVVFTTGRRSEVAAITLFSDLKEEAFIQIGDFFKASIESASSTSIKNCNIVVFFGKAVKMAMGFPHTHAAKSELTLKTLAQWADKLLSNINSEGAISPSYISSYKELAENIANSNTARHAFSYIYPDFPQLLSYVGMKIVEYAGKFSDNKLKVRAIILDFDGNKIFDSESN